MAKKVKKMRPEIDAKEEEEKDKDKKKKKKSKVKYTVIFGVRPEPNEFGAD